MSDLIISIFPLNETTNNIIQVSKKIKKIPNYKKYYNTILNYHYYSYSSKPELSKQIRITQENIESSTTIEFIGYFKQNNSLLNIIETYISLLECLQLLHQQNILYNGFFIFFDSSILFNKSTPIIHKFDYAIDCNLVSICSAFLNELDLSTPVPPELYILAYMSQNNITSISTHDIVNKMDHIIGAEYLVNKPYEYIITSLTKNQFNWDVYGLTTIFLHLIHHHINYEHKYFELFIKQLEQIIELGGVSTDEAKNRIHSIVM
jgi:hypothetical protein